MKKEKPPIPCVGNNCFFIDTHCHLDMKDYADDLDETLEKAHRHGVHSIITIGIDEKSSIAAVELAKKHPSIKASIGIHPHDVNQITATAYQRLKNLADDNKEHIVGYGEIGLDYAKLYAEPATQKKCSVNNWNLPKNFPYLLLSIIVMPTTTPLTSFARLARFQTAE